MIGYDKNDIFKQNSFYMETLVLDKKKYVVIEQKEYDSLRKRALLGDASGNKLMTIKEAKAYGLKLIDKWHKEKLELSKK